MQRANEPLIKLVLSFPERHRESLEQRTWTGQGRIAPGHCAKRRKSNKENSLLCTLGEILESSVSGMYQNAVYIGIRSAKELWPFTGTGLLTDHWKIEAWPYFCLLLGCLPGEQRSEANHYSLCVCFKQHTFHCSLCSGQNLQMLPNHWLSPPRYLRAPPLVYGPHPDVFDLKYHLEKKSEG